MIISREVLGNPNRATSHAGAGQSSSFSLPGSHVRELGAKQNNLRGIVDPDEHNNDGRRSTVSGFETSVRRGGTMVSVRASDADAARIEAILASYKPIDPVTRGAEYRKTGWAVFDEKAPPYQPSQTEIDRMRANWPI